MLRAALKLTALTLMTAGPVLAQDEAKPAADERLWTCETSIMGERTEINYVRDQAYRDNVGVIENRFSKWGKVSCPGYVTLREILRRNSVADDGSYCLLWDGASDTYLGARLGPRKANAVCRVTFCQRVNSTKAVAFQGANAMATAGYDAVTQWPGAVLLSATTGQLAGTIEGAGAAAAGLASSPVAAGAVLIGAAATGGALWYCSDGPQSAVIADEPMPEPQPYEPRPEDMPAAKPGDDVVWSSPLPPPVEAPAATSDPAQPKE